MYRKLLLAALFHALFGTSAFINLTVLNPIEHMVKEFCNETLLRYNYAPSSAAVSFLWSVLNACFPIGYLLSTFVIALCTERFGRKGTTMVINNIMLIFSSLLMWIGKEVNLFELMVVGRMIGGISQQVCMFTFIYLMECSDESNGLSAMILRCGGFVWYVLGSTFGLPALMGKPDLWKYTFLLPILPATVHLIGALWLPESPKHLYITKHEKSKGVEAIKFYQGPDVSIVDVTNEYEVEMAANGNAMQISIMQILQTKHLRWPFWICLMAEFSCRMGGFDIENYYSTGIINRLGISLETAALFNVILRAPSLIFMLIALVLVKRLQARPYLLGTLTGGLISITLLFYAQTTNYYEPDGTLSGVLGVVSLFVGISSWHLGSGYLPKFLPCKCCPQVSRSLTTAYQTAVRGFTAIAITVIYPPLATVIGPPLATLPIMISGYLSVIWLWKYLPETKDRSVDDVTREWMENSGSESWLDLQSHEEEESDTRKFYGSTETTQQESCKGPGPKIKHLNLSRF